MAPRIALRDVARAAGVHVTTVARAVKDDPRVHPATAVRLKELARQMGYRPDPMLSALMAYRRVKKAAHYRETVAWVTSNSQRSSWKVGAYLLYRAGAAEALQSHGYELEDFWLREPGLTSHRASQVLVSRGIRGLLICPVPVSPAHLNLEWPRFCVLTFGYSLASPQLHLATSSHYQATLTCLHHLHALGYRRIGLAVPSDLEERMNRMWTAAYRAYLPPDQALPPFYHDPGASPEPRQRPLFLEWYRRYRPEAIITNTGPVIDWLREGGHRSPEEVGVAEFNLQEDETDRAGIVEASREIGRAAGHHLAAMLQRGEYGIPSQPQRLTIDGVWRDGPTVRKIGPSVADTAPELVVIN